jgi:hypothetical protein
MKLHHQPKANDEMVQGYMDGYDLKAPEPSANRSASYRHGFMVGRGEKTGNLAGTYESLSHAADTAMAEDARRSMVA